MDLDPLEVVVTVVGLTTELFYGKVNVFNNLYATASGLLASHVTMTMRDLFPTEFAREKHLF